MGVFYKVPAIFDSSSEENMNAALSTDHDYNTWILLHQARDAGFKAREKELVQYGITTMEAGALFIIH